MARTVVGEMRKGRFCRACGQDQASGLFPSMMEAIGGFSAAP